MTKKTGPDHRARATASELSPGSLFESNQTVMLLIDPRTGQVVDGNPAACAFYGYDREELRRRFIYEINLTPRQELLERMSQAFGKLSHFYFQHRLADGEIRQVEVYSGPIEVSGRQLLYSIVHDITERLRVEESFRRTARELAVANRIADIFLTVPDEAMYGEVLETIKEVLESPFGLFGYLEEDGSLAAPSFSGEVWERCRMPDKALVLPRDKWGGVIREALEQARPVLSNGPLRVPQGHIPLTRALGVPVVYHGEVLGLVVVADRAVDYTPEELEFLTGIAARIAPVLHARLQRDRQNRQRERMEQAIQAIVGSMVGAIGQDFFDQVVRSLSSWLDAECCLVAEVMDGGSRGRALSMVVDSQAMKDFSYELKGTPCDMVHRHGFTFFPERVTELFPEDLDLVKLKAESYVGAPISNREGETIGLLCVISRKKLVLPERIREVMDVIAARAAAELERIKAEKDLLWQSVVNEALAEISGAIIRSVTLKALATLVLNYGRLLTGSREGYVGYLDFRTGWLRAGAWTEAVADSFEDQAAGVICREPHCCTEQPDRWEDSHLERLPAGHRLCLPAEIGGELVGRMLLLKDGEPFGERDRMLGGRLAGLFALAVSRQRDEQQLHKLFQAVEQSPSSIVITDPAGAIEYVNPRFSQLTGYSREELLGSNPRVLRSGQIPPELYRELWQTITAGGDWKGELLNRKKDGGLFWEMASISAVKNAEGGITNFIGIKEDITDLKRAQEELRAAHDKLESRVRERTAQLQVRLEHEALLAQIASRLNSTESFPQALQAIVEVIGARMRVDGAAFYRLEPEPRRALLLGGWANSQARPGIEPPELIGHDDLPELSRRLTTRCSLSLEDVGVLAARERDFLLSRNIRSLLVSPLSLAGELRGFLALTRREPGPWSQEQVILFETIADLIVSALERDSQFQARLEAERKETEAARLAEQSSRLASIGVIAAGITHEINQPLNAIKVTADSILYWHAQNQGVLPEFFVRKMDKISRGAGRIDEIIQHMRSFWVTPDRPLQEEFELGEAVRRGLSLVERQLSSHGIRLELALAEEPLAIYGSRIYLEQVVINLVANAMHALDEKGERDKRIEVVSRREEQQAVLLVRDNGIGIQEQDRERLFDPFFSRRKPGQGMGLGLAVVERYVHSMQGKVAAANNDTGGATFTVRLPLADGRGRESQDGPAVLPYGGA